MKLEHVAINVPEPVQMAEWYVAHCGMRVVLSVEGPPFTRFIADTSGTVALELYRNEEAPIPDYPNQSHLVVHNAFVAENLDKMKDRLTAGGATFVEEINTPDGSRLIMLRDPWGIPLQIVKRSAAQAWY
jgi:catechol 2,3-dioxygenase-like lactoylglutathione lyase family enzyme